MAERRRVRWADLEEPTPELRRENATLSARVGRPPRRHSPSFSQPQPETLLRRNETMLSEDVLYQQIPNQGEYQSFLDEINRDGDIILTLVGRSQEPTLVDSLPPEQRIRFGDKPKETFILDARVPPKNPGEPVIESVQMRQTAGQSRAVTEPELSRLNTAIFRGDMPGALGGATPAAVNFGAGMF